MKTAWIGCDPGVTGAIALIHDGNAQVWDTPNRKVRVGQKERSEYDLEKLVTVMEAIKEYCEDEGLTPSVVLEKVGTMPHDGVVGAFSFGKGYGQWQGILAALKLPFQVVSPLVWKRRFGLLGADKRECMPIAKELYPSVADRLTLIRHHDRGDAVLLAEWGRLVSE